MNKIVIGSRKSPLALIQSQLVKAAIEEAFPLITVETRTIITKGDRVLDQPLAEIGEKGLFTEEIEAALMKDEIALAVHSLKDLPTTLPEGLEILACLAREEPRDCLVSEKFEGLDNLPHGAQVGTSSLRRRSQLLYLRPDLKVVAIRGNVETRLKKLIQGDADAIVIAAAGLIRLGLGGRISEMIQTDCIVPAVGQGIIAVEGKGARDDLRPITRAISDTETELAALAERAIMRTFGGGCHIPIGALARVDGENIEITAYVGSVDGKKAVKKSMVGPKIQPQAIGERLANEMLREGAGDIIAELLGSG